MVVLHLFWNERSHNFILWGESKHLLLHAIKNLATTTLGDNHELESRNYPSHPYSVPSKKLEGIMEKMISKYRTLRRFRIEPIEILCPLPSFMKEKGRDGKRKRKKQSMERKFPLPSSKLEQIMNKKSQIQWDTKKRSFSFENRNIKAFFSNAKKSKSRKYAGFKIKALEIPLVLMVKFILHDTKVSNEKQILTNNKEYSWGSTFTFWKEVSMFGFSLLLKNRYIPNIKKVHHTLESNIAPKTEFLVHWKVSLSTFSKQNLYTLLTKIPPISLVQTGHIGKENTDEGQKHIKELQDSEKGNKNLTSRQDLKNASQLRMKEPEIMVKRFLNELVDTYIRDLFNSVNSPTSKKFVIDKMCMIKKNQRDFKQQKLLELMAKALFSPQKKLILARSDIAHKYQKYLALTNPNKDLNVDKPFYTCLKIIAPKENKKEEKKKQLTNPFGSELETKQLFPDGTNEENGEKQWKIKLYLQSKQDLSAIISAEKIWRGEEEAKNFSALTIDNLQAHMLEDLKEIKDQYTCIENILEKPQPIISEVSVEEIYLLIKNTEKLREFQNIKIIVPSKIKKAPSKIGMALHINMGKNGRKDRRSARKDKNRRKDFTEKIDKSSMGNLGVNSIVEYDWRIALGDYELSEKEFKKLSQLKVPLMNIQGNWFELSPEDLMKVQQLFEEETPGTQKKKEPKKNKTEIEALHEMKEMKLNELTRSFTKSRPLGDVLRMGVKEQENVAELPILKIEGDKEFNQFMDGMRHPEKIKKLEKIPHFHGKLRPYQRKGVNWLNFMRRYGLGACLADDMGLGKTIQIIALFLHEKFNLSSQKETLKALVICPLSVLGNWKREINRFAPDLKVFIHHENNRLEEGDLHNIRNLKQDVVLTTYGLALGDKHLFQIPRWNSVILDESQNIKNHQAKTTRAVKKIKAGHKLALTGTPIENRLSELWSLMDFLNPGLLGRITEFKRKFIKPIEREHDKTRAAKLKRLIQPFILRRLKTDKKIIKDLPEKMEMDVYCNLTREQATLYDATVNDMIQKIEEEDGIKRRGLILSTITKLKQICNHPAQFLHSNKKLKNRSGKLMRLGEMVSEAISEGDKVLIFSQFKEMGKIIKRYLGRMFQVKIPFLHGGVPQKKRDKMVQTFQSKSMEHPIFVVSLKAGGTGLNLTAANNVFHYDRWWNPAVENQATDRAYRIGQTKNVNVYKFTCMGTIEEKIMETIEKKRKLADQIIGSGEGWITELSTEELKSLMKLNVEEAIL